MAARTTSQTGNWNASSTWGGNTPPGVGDTATINHTVTVTADVTVGTSPADTTTFVLTINAPLTINDGVTFRVRGNTVQTDTGDDVTVGAGSVLEVDDTLAASPQVYIWRKGNAFNARPGFRVNGTQGSPSVVRKNSSGSRFAFTAGASANGAHYLVTWTTFRGCTLGGSTGYQSGGPDPIGVNFSDCYFDDAPLALTHANYCPFSLTRCLWLNTSTTDAVSCHKNALVTNWAPTLTNCGFDKRVNLQAKGGTFTDCAFLGGFTWSTINSAAGSRANGFTRCLFRATADTNTRWGDWTDCIFIRDASTYDGLGRYSATDYAINPHCTGPLNAEAGRYTCDGCVFESFGSDSEGDVDYGPSSTRFSTFLRCLWVPDPLAFGGVAIDGTRPAGHLGTLTTNNATGGTNVYEHCTYYQGSQGALALAELGNGAAGIVDSVRSNIFWNDPLRAGTGSFNKVAYQPTAPAGAVADMVNTAQAGWNAIHNLNPAVTKTNAVPYYDTNFTSSAGVGQNDIVTDPEFVDSSRKFNTWVASLESSWGDAPSGNYPANASPNRTDYNAHGLYKIAVGSSLREEHADYDSRYTAAAYRTYVRNGFAPQNPLLRDAGHDGVTIGAVEGSFSTGGRGLLLRWVG